MSDTAMADLIQDVLDEEGEVVYFTHLSNMGGAASTTTVLSSSQTDELCSAFLKFLHAAGFNYISGVALFNQDGDIHSSTDEEDQLDLFEEDDA